MRQGTEDRRQGAEPCDRGWRTGDKEQRCKTGDIGWETKYKDVRQGTKDVRQATGEGDRGMGDRGKRGKTLKMHVVLQNDFRVCSATEYKGKKA